MGYARQASLELRRDAQAPAEPRSKLLLIFLGWSTVSLIMTFLLLAAAVYIH